MTIELLKQWQDEYLKLRKCDGNTLSSKITNDFVDYIHIKLELLKLPNEFPSKLKEEIITTEYITEQFEVDILLIELYNKGKSWEQIVQFANTNIISKEHLVDLFKAEKNIDISRIIGFQLTCKL